MSTVSDIMTRNVKLVSPDESIRAAAMAMARDDVGSLPVGENDRLVGMITDRDIAVRAVAQGRDAETKVREVMSEGIRYCYEDEDTDHVARNMASLGVRRLPVVDRDKRLVGIVALSNVVQSRDGGGARDTLLDGVAQPH
jgi:CBS domain-containing protein